MLKQILQFLLLILIASFIWFAGPFIAIDGSILLKSPITRLSSILLIAFLWGGYYFFLSINKERKKNRLKCDHQMPLNKNQNTTLIETQSDEIQFDEPFAMLTRHFEHVKKYCEKRYHKMGWRKLFWRSKENKTSIHLILGTNQSGKSHLLQNSGLKLKVIPAPMQHPIQTSSSRGASFGKIAHDGVIEYDHTNTPTTEDERERDDESVDIAYWYINDNHIFLDTPGEYATSEVGKKPNTPWRKLLNLLQNSKHNFPITSLTLTINIAELIQQRKQQTRLQIHLLKQRILELRKQVGKPFPLYIILTKCDLIKGFREYFDNLNQDDRLAPLGITLRENSDNINSDKDDESTADLNSAKSMTDAFRCDLDNLLQQINALVITRLHQEHHPDKRNLIKEFPVQFDRVKELLANIVYHLAEKSSLSGSAQPMGIYFTSSEQSGKPVDILDELLNNTFSLNKKALMPLAIKSQTPHKTFFIHQLLKKIGHTQTHSSINHRQQDSIGAELSNTLVLNPFTWKHRTIIGLSCLVLLVGSLLITNHFNSDLLQINDTTNSLHTYLLLKKDGNTAANLNAEKSLITHYKNASHFWIFNHIPSVHNTFQNKKSLHLKTPMGKTSKQEDSSISKLTQLIEHDLQQKNLQPDFLYDDLKIYLMLAHPSKMEPHFIISWIQHRNITKQLQNTINSLAAKKKFAQQLHQYSINKSGITPKISLIKNSRLTLNCLPKTYLAYLILKSRVEVRNAKNLQLSFIGKEIKIPRLYTAMGLQTLFLNNYQNAAKEAITGNWILGMSNKNLAPKSLLVTRTNTENQLITLYTADYSHWWINKFYQIQLPTPTTLPQISSLLTQLTDPKNGLMSLLNTFISNSDSNQILPPGSNNTKIAAIRQSLQKQFGNRLAALEKISPIAIQNALTQFNHFINTISQSNDINAASFAVAKMAFEHPNNRGVLNGFKDYAQSLPDPFKQSFASIASVSWQQIINHTRSYINHQWQTTVVPEYNQNLVNKYPLYQHATADVDLNAFKHFFGKTGTLNLFYNTYFKAFINTATSEWQWKKVEGQSLNFSPTLFQFFERGKIITTMFFNHSDNKINVRFTLQQIAMMPIIKSLHLVINGQSLTDQQGTKNISTFIWPGNSGNYFANVLISNVNGQHVSTSTNGPWSLFHLLDHSQIQSTPHPKKFKVTFNIDGNEAQYQLIADNQINPFIPGIIGLFRLPESL